MKKSLLAFKAFTLSVAGVFDINCKPATEAGFSMTGNHKIRKDIWPIIYKCQSQNKRGETISSASFSSC
jgi:hypothetical protein